MRLPFLFRPWNRLCLLLVNKACPAGWRMPAPVLFGPIGTSILYGRARASAASSFLSLERPGGARRKMVENRPPGYGVHEDSAEHVRVALLHVRYFLGHALRQADMQIDGASFPHTQDFVDHRFLRILDPRHQPRETQPASNGTAIEWRTR